jgi:membrane protein implicated in regulation of membrane protease activity
MGDILGSSRVASVFSSVRLSFSLGDSIRVASEVPWNERNNLMVFLFLKILFIYFTRRYSRRVKRSEKRAVTDV